MLGCNDNVTVWNRFRNPETGKDEWYRKVLPVKCKWKTRIERNISAGVASVANSFTLIVPQSEYCKSPQEWDALNAGEKARFFTFREGDVVAEGVHKTEITGVKPFTESEVKAMLAPNVMVIKAVQDNTRVMHGKHLRIDGV